MLLPQSHTWITMPFRLNRNMGLFSLVEPEDILHKRSKKISVDFNNLINNNSTDQGVWQVLYVCGKM